MPKHAKQYRIERDQERKLKAEWIDAALALKAENQKLSQALQVIGRAVLTGLSK